MDKQEYSKSEEYQKEIAEQYKKRVIKIGIAEVAEVLEKLSIIVPDVTTIKESSVGNMNATYLTADLAIKINTKKDNARYLANKVASDALGNDWPIIKVIAYDFFNKTNYEVLVMERSRGRVLLEDIFDLSQESMKEIFQQVLETIKMLFQIEYQNFGLINEPNNSFSRYSDYLRDRFNKNNAAIKRQKLADENDLEKIEKYFLKYVSLFDKEQSVYALTDVQMGNMLHEGNKLTALIDFDYSLKAPKVRTVAAILGFIGEPEQFVEGTKDYPRFKGQDFCYLSPMLQQKLPEVFADKHLLRKLNIIGIGEMVMWVAQNWSAEWNKQMIARVLDRELAGSEVDLKKSYYGRILTCLKY
jgi:hypothetical protein